MLPRRALTDFDLMKYAKSMKIPFFCGVFMRNDLPKGGPRKRESVILNLDDKKGPGSHWVSYKKIDDEVIYFDSFGNLRPPSDLMNYLGVGSIKYNHEIYQNYDTFVCGHLCLKFLCNQLKSRSMYNLYTPCPTTYVIPFRV